MDIPVNDSNKPRPPVSAVLLVEDDSAVVDATSMMLEESGYEVRTAEDARTALLHVARGFRPDLIIADYRLPGHNGIEVVQRVRARTHAQVPAIIITGDTSSREILAARPEHVQVLRKPMNVDHFIDLIEQWSRPDGWQRLAP